MKLHDLRPVPGANVERTRVGRGIAAGKGKTAGRGTKGQKARGRGSLPPWFEGGQTPIHMRVPRLRGFKRRFKIDYEVVNVGRISEYAERGAFADAEEAAAEALAAGARSAPAADAPLTINAELLRHARLISNVRRPVKVLGNGEVHRRLFVVADAFTRSAREKIEAAGGTAQVLEVPEGRTPAIGLDAPAADGAETLGTSDAPDAAEGADRPDAASADAGKRAPRARQSPRPASRSG